MCWQPLSLKDPNSQELLDAVELERPYRSARHLPSRNSMDEFEFHQVPAYADDSDFEERIMQHLAAAARAHHFARREMLRNRPSSVRDHPQLLVMPTHSPSSQVTSSGNFTSLSAVGPARVQPQEQLVHPGGQVDGASPHTARSLSDPVRASEINTAEIFSSRRERHTSGLEPLEESQQRTGSAEFISFSESLKSRFAAASSRYKETFTKTTRGFREKLRTRNNTMTDLGARAREVSAGVVRALERMSLESSGRSRGEDDMPTTSRDSADVDRLPSVTEVESPSKREATIGTVCTSNNLGGTLSGPADSVSHHPSSGDAGIGLDGTFSKDIEGSSGGSDAQVTHTVASHS